MPEEEQKDNGNLKEQDGSYLNKKKLKMGLTIGISAGVIWGFLSLLAYYLQFTDVGPSMYAKPILNPDYVLKWEGHFIGLGFFIILTTIFSLIYVAFFTRFKTPWAGIIYGIFLWTLVFVVVNPMLDLTKSVKELGLNSNSVMICLYILTGLFIGYSLSVEFNNEDKSGVNHTSN